MSATSPAHRLAPEPPWRALVAAAALTVGLHLGVLGVWPGGGPLRGGPAPASGAPALAWQVRTVTASGETAAHAAEPTTAPHDAQRTATPLPAPVADRPEPATWGAPASSGAHTPSPASAEPPPTVQAADAPGERGDEEYLPRRRLTRAPRAAEVWIPYPEQAPLGRWALRLTVFIDEQGRVRRVRPSGPLPADDPDSEVPAELLDAAVQAFLATRYTPGELKGRAVKSRIEIAVEFRADAPPRSAAGD